MGWQDTPDRPVNCSGCGRETEVMGPLPVKVYCADCTPGHKEEEQARGWPWKRNDK